MSLLFAQLNRAARTVVSTRFFSSSLPRLNSIASAAPPASLNEGEKHLYTKLFEKFQPSTLVVEDISGMLSASSFSRVVLLKELRGFPFCGSFDAYSTYR